MEKIAFIVDRLNQAPFRKNIPTMTELDSKSGNELLDLYGDVLVAIDNEHEAFYKEPLEYRVQRVMTFLSIMKFNIPSEQYDDFQQLVMMGDKEILYTIMHWTLQRFEQLQKRSYLSKYLMPLDIPAEFLNDELIVELSEQLKILQSHFKEAHKGAEQVRSSSVKPSDLKAEITQLEQEKTQLKNKIERMKKEMSGDEHRFKQMLEATSSLRKEQETEVMNHEKMREQRRGLQEADLRFTETNRRLQELRQSGIQTQSAEQILTKLHSDVRELGDKKDNVERIITEREMHLEKLQSWDNSDRVTTEDDVRMKADQVEDLKDAIASLSERLDNALEKNTKLVVFRQASTMAMKKFREKEEEVETLQDECRRINRQMEEKEQELRQQSRAANANKITKKELKRYGGVVKEKIEVYKKMREELGQLRSELVVLQRTEQILRSRDTHLEQFLQDLERQKGVEGYRDTQRAIVEMTEKAAEIDHMKGATLEEISGMVEKISREFRNKQAQLQPLITELKAVRQEYLDMESTYQDKKMTYEKVAVGLDMEKQGLEKECNQFQEESLREESRYFYLQNLISMAKIRMERCEQEKRWQSGKESMLRDIKCLKDLYAQKLSQQDLLTKQLRKKQKELKENSGALTNQKTNFSNLQMLLDAKSKLARGESIKPAENHDGYPTAYAEPIMYGTAEGDHMTFGDHKDYY